MHKHFKIKLALFLLVVSGPLIAQKINKKSIDELYNSAFEFEESDSMYQIAVEIQIQSNVIDYDYGLVQSKILASYYFYNTYNLDTAKTLLNECLTYFNKHSSLLNTIDYGRCLYYLGNVHYKLGELRLSKKHMHNVLTVFEKLDDIDYQNKALFMLGAIEFGFTDYPKALEHFSKAYQNKLNQGESEENCRDEIANIARIYHNMGQTDRALELSHKILRLSEIKNDSARVINTLNTIGSFYSTLNKFDSAAYYYTKCKDLALINRNTARAFLAEYNIANMYHNRGMFKTSNTLTQDLFKKGYNVIPSMKIISQTLVAKNFLELAKYDSCVLVAQPIFKEVWKNGSKQSALNVSKVLTKAYQKLERYDSSNHYLTMQLAYTDSLYNLDTQRKLSSLYAELETFEKESEIQKLEFEKYRNNIRTAILVVIMGLIIFALMFVFWLYKIRQHKKHQVLEKRRRQLEEQLEQNKKKLYNHTLSMVHKNNLFEEIEHNIKEIQTRCKEGEDLGLRKIISSININKTLENDWINFMNFFSDIHLSFFEYLDRNHPELSDYEMRLCALIKLKLANKEIATILSIEHKSVKMAKYRLKKKLNLEDNQSLSDYISKIGFETTSNAISA